MFLGLQTLWPRSLTKPVFFFFWFRVFFRACSLQNEVGDPPFFFLYISGITNSSSHSGKSLRKNQCWKIFSWTSLSENFDLSFTTLQWGFPCIVWPSVLSLNNLEINQTKAVKNICIQEIFILLLTLTGFRTTQPRLQQVNLTWAREPIENQCLVSGQLPKNTWPRLALNLRPLYGHVILVGGYLALTGVNRP